MNIARVIEVDGEIHNTRQAEGQNCQQWLNCRCFTEYRGCFATYC
jgi:hypothetical protein